MLKELRILQQASPTEEDFRTLVKRFPAFGNYTFPLSWNDGSLLPGYTITHFYTTYQAYPTSMGEILRAAQKASPKRGVRHGLLSLAVDQSDFNIELPASHPPRTVEVDDPLMRKFLDQVEYIDFEMFQTYLWYAAQKFFTATRKESYMCYYEEENKSNYWTLKVLFHLIDQTRRQGNKLFRFPVALFKYSQGRIIMNLVDRETGVLAAQRVLPHKHTPLVIDHFLFVDDCSYTGIQLEWLAKTKILDEHVTFKRRHVLLSACGTRNRVVEMPEASLHCVKFLPDLHSLFSVEEYTTLLRWEKEIYATWEDMEALDLDLRPRYAVYFDHKLADATSVPTGLISFLIDNCDYKQEGMDNANPFCPPPPYKREVNHGLPIG